MRSRPFAPLVEDLAARITPSGGLPPLEMGPVPPQVQDLTPVLPPVSAPDLSTPGGVIESFLPGGGGSIPPAVFTPPIVPPPVPPPAVVPAGPPAVTPSMLPPDAFEDGDPDAYVPFPAPPVPYAPQDLPPDMFGF